MGVWVVLFVFRDVIDWAGVISAVLLEDSVVTTGAVSNVLTTLPIGVTVAIGSACILDPAPTVGGAATVGNTVVLVSVKAACVTASKVFLSDAWSSPACAKL